MLRWGDIVSAALAKFFSVNTGTTYSAAVAGSIVKEIVDNVESSTGSGDWTDNEKAEIKTILGVTGTGTPDDTPSDGSIKEVQDKMPTPYDVGP